MAQGAPPIAGKSRHGTRRRRPTGLLNDPRAVLSSALFGRRVDTSRQLVFKRDSCNARFRERHFAMAAELGLALLTVQSVTFNLGACVLTSDAQAEARHGPVPPNDLPAAPVFHGRRIERSDCALDHADLAYVMSSHVVLPTMTAPSNRHRHR